MGFIGKNNIDSASAKRLFNEALIGRKNSKNAIAGAVKDLYLVDTFEDFFDTAEKRYKKKQVGPKFSGVYILTRNEVDWIASNTEIPLSKDPNEDLKVYDLSLLSERELEGLRHDLKNGTANFLYIISTYRLEPIKLNW